MSDACAFRHINSRQPKTKIDCRGTSHGTNLHRGHQRYFMPHIANDKSTTGKLPPLRVWEVTLTHDPSLGGLFRSVQDFAAATDSHILSFDDSRNARPRLDESGCVHRIACDPVWLNRDCLFVTPSMKRTADRIVASAESLVVHSLFRGHATWATRWATAHRRRYVAVPHGCLDPVGMQRRSVIKRAWMQLHGLSYLRNANAVIFASTREMEHATKWLPFGRPQVIHWPIPLPPVIDVAPCRISFRKRHDIPLDHDTLLFVGRLHSIKRLHHLLNAFRLSALPNCSLVIVGMDGNLTRDSLVHYANATGCRNVRILGALEGPYLADAYRASDAYISLSYRENFSYSMADALSYGLPVIVSPNHYLAYDIHRLDNRKFPCGWHLEDDSLAVAVAGLRAFGTATTAQRRDMGGHGRAWVQESLGWDKFAAEVRATLAG